MEMCSLTGALCKCSSIAHFPYNKWIHGVEAKGERRIKSKEQSETINFVFVKMA